MRGIARRSVVIIRWWAGITYLLGGIGLVLAAPVMLASGNPGGIFALLGGAEIALLGWFVHPWGRQRQRRDRHDSIAPPA